jgi:succinate-acetate transporter protein
MAEFTASGAERIERAVGITTPLPLAMGVFGLTTTIIGSIFAGFIVRGAGAGLLPGVVASFSMLAAVAFFGGLVQLLAGLAELRRDNMLSGTIFTSYGGFLMMLGVIMAPTLNILNNLLASRALNAALGLFFLVWTIFAAILFLSSLRMPISYIATLALLFLSYLFLTIGELAGGSTTWLVIGGWLGIICGLVALYTSFAGLLGANRSTFHLPM